MKALHAIAGLVICFNCWAGDYEATPAAWRQVDGVNECIKGPGWQDEYVFHRDSAGKAVFANGWHEFTGVVVEVQPGGLRVRGFPGVLIGSDDVFFVTNYPFQVADGDSVHGIAKDVGLYTYATVLGSSATLHKFDCGIPVNPPAPPPVDQAALDEARAKKKAEIAANALKANLEAANAGDWYGQLRMGERYRDGEGVAKDPRKAREWLAKAAAQGDKTAKKELECLP